MHQIWNALLLFGQQTITLSKDGQENKEPYMLFVDGNLLKHPTLETGDRVRMKILRVNPKADLETKSIKETIGLAISTRTKKPDHK